MKMYGLLFHLGNLRSKRELRKRYGDTYSKQFYLLSKRYFPQIVAKTPDIGKSVFSFNYAFAPAYIAWYKAAKDLNMPEKDIQKVLWLMNEKIIKTIPRIFRKAYGKIYLRNFQKNAPKQEARKNIHPYDYTVKYLAGDDTHFGIDITRCGMRTLAKDFDAMGIFPTVCRVDYMIGNLLHLGYTRTKILSDGDECCNGRFEIGGKCHWSEDMTFIDRK